MDRSLVGSTVPLGLAVLLLAALAAPSQAIPPASKNLQPIPPVCFWSDQGPVCREPTPGLSGASLEAEGLIQALLGGPTPEEEARGLWSAIPPSTTLAGVSTDLQIPGGAEPRQVVTVRLRVPEQGLENLDHTTFEALVQQIGGTLEPLGWDDLHIQTVDPDSGDFVPLADFLPPLPIPRKETVSSGEETGPVPRLGHAGQPPGFGQGQPVGGLSGKTVYVSAGHGWQWNGAAWRVQRPPYPTPPYEGPIIEDHNNAEAVNQYLLQYLWNAGAQVWPVRERDMNTAEAIVDDDNPGAGNGFSASGTWTPCGSGYDGSGYDGSNYLQATTVTGTGPTATATWTTTLPADGQYAVTVWYRPGSDRAPDARYTVHHAGGETTVSVDQRHHGITWHYIGSYGFRAGEVVSVTLDNLSTQAGKVVVADAVRFGGGTFDDLTGIQTTAPSAPDKPWWEVAAFYQVQRMGLDPDDCPYFNDVVARPMYARWEHAATGDDAVYVSWHTNGVSGYQTYARGTMSIVHNGDGKPVTAGSELLRNLIHSEVVNDIRAGWDPTWPETTRSMNLGELRELWDPAYPIPGMLIEVAYHDHPDDTDTLKEPPFNMLVARAIYQGILHYFDADGVELPEPPTHLAVENVGGGQVRVRWQPSPTDSIGLLGDAASEYRVYTSPDGLGWADGLRVSAGTSYTLTGLSSNQLLFVRVSAVNDGGESFPTETLAARVGSEADVLLVNGFDRLNRTMTILDDDDVEGPNMRMDLDSMNRYDYVVQHGQVISYPFDSASNEAVADVHVPLTQYSLVDWILGEESAPDETLDSQERTLLQAYLDGGGALFLSGSEVAWHLDDQGGDRDFLHDYLRAEYNGDDAGTYQVTPVGGSIFDGLSSFYFDAPGMYDADYPDRLTATNGATPTLAYTGGLGGTAAIQYAGPGCERVVFFGFPFETIRPAQRAAVMGRVIDFLDQCVAHPVDTVITVPSNGSAHRSKPIFIGTADAGGTGSLQYVEAQIQRASDGQYWTGFTWIPTDTWRLVDGTEMWSYDSNFPDLTDGTYDLRARAWTTTAVSDTTPAQVRIIYDTIPPTHTTLVTPTGGISLTTPAVRLEWQMVSDGGSDLGYMVAVGDDLYTTTQSVLTVTQTGAGVHVWGVQVFDAAGNRSAWVTDTFSLDQFPVYLPLVARDHTGGPELCPDALVNGDFEASGGWGLNNLAFYDTTQVHGGARSARVGILPTESCTQTVYSSISQTVALPAGSTATLKMWVYPINEGDDAGDVHYVWLVDQWEGYESLDRTTTDDRAWVEREYDLSARTGQTVTLFIGAMNDGDEHTAALYVDDVSLEVCP